LHFFLVAFAITAAAMYVPTDAHWLRNALSLLLVLIYVAYVGITLRASERLVRQGHRTEAAEAMFFARLGLPTSWATILLQLGLGLVLLIAGAKGFILGVEGAASQLGVSALLLSLIVIPIATELPEKVNSIIWVRRGRDTLALGTSPGRWCSRVRCCRQSASC